MQKYNIKYNKKYNCDVDNYRGLRYEKENKNKKYKERYRNRNTSNINYQMFKNEHKKTFYNEFYSLPNAKDGHNRKIKTQQEKKLYIRDLYDIKKYNMKRKSSKSLPDSRNAPKSMLKDKSWKETSKRKNQWY